MTHLFASTQRLAKATSRDRNRVVDLMRVASILIVVSGHWLMAAVMIEKGSIVGDHILNAAPWSRPLTWLLQVMPIFFLVGGYSNALSWRSAQGRGESYGGWLRARLRRLTVPVLPLLAVWGVAGWIALRVGVDADILRMASAVALGPTWFLAAYVLIVCLVPGSLLLWDRLGWWSIGVGLGLAGVMDLVSIGFGLAPFGFVNYIFVWGSVHQLGYAWADKKIERAGMRVGLLLAGFAATLALVWAGPYPVAMVGFDSGELTNSLPPRVTLGFLGVFQAGLVLVFERGLSRWMERRRPWGVVVMVSAQIMTLYLWHLTSMIVLIAAGMAFSGFGFGIEPFTGVWWLTRPIWMVALTVVTVLLALVFGRFERPHRDARRAPSPWRPVLGAAMICGGLGSMAALGIVDDAGLNGVLVALPVAGMMIGGVMGASLFDRIGKA